MLTMLEETVLLAVDENTGRLRSTTRFGTAYALGGALFFDLALAKKIDTGTWSIEVVDTAANTGNPAMDHFLGEISKRTDINSVRGWIEEAFGYKEYLEEEALRSLTARGILRHAKTKRLWVIDVERFPLVDSKKQLHVKLRLAEAILSDTIPATRDIMLVSLADACGLLGYILSAAEIASRRGRIQMLRQLETISREVTEAIADLDQHIKTAMNNAV